MRKLSTLAMAHDFIRGHVKAGDFCIDATAGNGGDTLLLCHLVGASGRVLAFDIQESAVENTKALLAKEGKSAEVLLKSHHCMAEHAMAEAVDLICFNFGYLPGGDHSIGTQAESSIAAIEAGLGLLKNKGAMSLCIYYGGDSGFDEKNALMDYLKTIDFRKYTVLVHDFYNRPNNPPIFVKILKDS